jgi:predicted esterase
MLSRTLVVFLHGSGGTGPDLRSFLDLVPLEQFGHKTFRTVAKEKNIEYICPTAALRPYTAAMGQKMNVWFDRSDDFTRKGLNDSEDLETANSSVTQILSLIDSMEESYVDIFVGGFSQGGCLSLHLMRGDISDRLSKKVRGIFSMGSFLVKNSVVLKKSVNDNVFNLPLFMMHGEEDSLILYEWGQSTATSLLLENRDMDIQFKGYAGLDHDIGDEEVSFLVCSCVYVYIYIIICVYVHFGDEEVSICIYIYMYKYVYMYVCVYIHVYIYMYMYGLDHDIGDEEVRIFNINVYVYIYITIYMYICTSGMKR